MVPQIKVLVVEDSDETAELIRRALEREGCAVERVPTLGYARARLATEPPDVVVLDVELPDGSGLELLREIGGSSDVPVVIVSGRKSEVDRVLGLELGAEDYVIKPFFPRELATRVRRAATRPRQQPASLPSKVIELEGLRIDTERREVRAGGVLVELTTREFDLLVHLASAPGRVFGRDELLRDVWHSQPDWQSAKTVTEHIRRVRQKLEPDPANPRWVHTVGRSGYRIEG